MKDRGPQSESVLITGAASGLGAALAKHYLARGATVTGYDLDAPEIAGIHFIQGDLTGEPPAFDAAADTFDVVILNAGISAFGNFTSLSWEAQQKVIDTNFSGHLRFLHRLMAAGCLKDGSRLALVLSAAVYTPVPLTAIYSASKTGLEGFATAMEPLLRDRGSSVTRVYPGQLRTPHLEKYYGNINTKGGADPEKVARRIVRALDHRRRRVYPDSMSRVFRLLSILIPGFLPAVILRFTKRRFGDILNS